MNCVAGGTAWREITSDEADRVAGGRWASFHHWDDLLYQNYSHGEELEDGTIAAWLLEDWEIYGPGGGGYWSSGPFGNWQADIQTWLQNGSMLAHDLIRWDAGQLQSNNLSSYTQQSAIFGASVGSLIGNGSILPVDSNPTFGAAGSGAKYGEGEIVVTGTRYHSDSSVTYRFASFDPHTHQYVSWAHNVSYLDNARAEADARIIRFEEKTSSPLTEAELSAVEAMKAGIYDLMGSLQSLPAGSYFLVDGWGKVPVSELVMLLKLGDWHVYDPGTLQNNPIAQVSRGDGNPLYKIERDDLIQVAASADFILFVLAHETAHATRVGWNKYMATPVHQIPGVEMTTNEFARVIAATLGKTIPEDAGGAYGFDIGAVTFHVPSV
jgi:hypothetical protein